MLPCQRKQSIFCLDPQGNYKRPLFLANMMQIFLLLISLRAYILPLSGALVVVIVIIIRFEAYLVIKKHIPLLMFFFFFFFFFPNMRFLLLQSSVNVQLYSFFPNTVKIRNRSCLQKSSQHPALGYSSSDCHSSPS